MTTSYPTGLDTYTHPNPNDPRSGTTSLSTFFSNIQDAVSALETKVGIDSSAVNTSLDYKLSGVTTGDKAVSKTGTETLTNKTLTAPKINIGGDATGDIYYRDGSGNFQRLAAGAGSTILNTDSVSGLPAWIPNPAASNASTTVKGVGQIAATADITAGTSTGSTGAILLVPASAVGAAGANKLVQFDSSGKYPAADGSQITNTVNSTIYKNGVVTYSGTKAGGTVVIAHGCGKTPKFVEFVSRSGAVNSIGFYNGTTTSTEYIDNASASGNSSTYVVYLVTNAGSGFVTQGTIAVDATNITITWVTDGSGGSATGTGAWRAEA